MQFGRALVWIGGVAVIGVAAFLYFGPDRTGPEEAASEIADARQSEAGDLASPAGEQTRASRMAAAREKRRAAREQTRQRAESAAAEAARTDTEAGSARAAAERRRRESGTEAGGAREPRPEAVSDRAQIEALFRAAAEAPPQEAPERRDESASETPDEGDPESAPGKQSVGSPVVMNCVSDAWICNSYNLAFQMQGTIPVISGGREAIYIPFSAGSGEVWISNPPELWRFPVARMTNAGQVAEFVSRVPN